MTDHPDTPPADTVTLACASAEDVDFIFRKAEISHKTVAQELSPTAFATIRHVDLVSLWYDAKMAHSLSATAPQPTDGVDGQRIIDKPTAPGDVMTLEEIKEAEAAVEHHVQCGRRFAVPVPRPKIYRLLATARAYHTQANELDHAHQVNLRTQEAWAKDRAEIERLKAGRSGLLIDCTDQSEKITALEAENKQLRELLQQGLSAVQWSYAEAQAEWQHHDKRMADMNDKRMTWESKVRTALKQDTEQ